MSEHKEDRPTDAPFGPEEAERIMQDAREEHELFCPRCGGPLQIGSSASPTTSQFTVFLVRCPTCRRAVFHGTYRPTKG